MTVQGDRKCPEDVGGGETQVAEQAGGGDGKGWERGGDVIGFSNVEELKREKLG